MNSSILEKLATLHRTPGFEEGDKQVQFSPSSALAMRVAKPQEEGGMEY